MKKALLFCASVSIFGFSAGCNTGNDNSSLKIRDDDNPNWAEKSLYCSIKSNQDYYYIGFGMMLNQASPKIYVDTNHFNGNSSAPWANAVGSAVYALGDVTITGGSLELHNSSGQVVALFNYSGTVSDVDAVLMLQEDAPDRLKIGEGKGEFLDAARKPILSGLSCTFLGNRTLSAPRAASQTSTNINGPTNQPTTTSSQPEPSNSANTEPADRWRDDEPSDDLWDDYF